MKKFIIINLFLSAMGLTSGCKHDYPEPAAPEISFSKHVQPIITGSCTVVECHGTNGEFPLLSYSDVIMRGEIKDADEPKLLEVLKTTDEDDRMPRPPAPPLTSNQIQIIELWIKQGAKNN